MFEHDNPFIQYSISEDGKEYCIDARKKASISRFIRNSCRPNARIMTVRILKTFAFLLNQS